MKVSVFLAQALLAILAVAAPLAEPAVDNKLEARDDVGTEGCGQVPWGPQC